MGPISCGGGSSSNIALGPGSCNFQQGGPCSPTVNWVSRTYVLHVPANYQRNSSALVIALHSSQASGSQMESSSGLSTKADQAGFAVAYPDALLSSQGHTLWSVFYNDFAFTGTPPDDVSFLRGLIIALEVPRKCGSPVLSPGRRHSRVVQHAEGHQRAGALQREVGGPRPGSLATISCGISFNPTPNHKAPPAL